LQSQFAGLAMNREGVARSVDLDRSSREGVGKVLVAAARALLIVVISSAVERAP
jgi:hypothetical protein